MLSNQRLIRQVERDLFSDADVAWEKVYSQFCKRQADLDPKKVMQFKYKGKIYKLAEDVQLRSGVMPLNKELEPEFSQLYAMFVTEAENEKRVLKNMLAHAIRIAKYEEDLLELLPKIMHESIQESGFFQHEDKPLMSVKDADSFRAMYSQYFDMFDMRKTIGSIM